MLLRGSLCSCRLSRGHLRWSGWSLDSFRHLKIPGPVTFGNRNTGPVSVFTFVPAGFVALEDLAILADIQIIAASYHSSARIFAHVPSAFGAMRGLESVAGAFAIRIVLRLCPFALPGDDGGLSPPSISVVGLPACCPGTSSWVVRNRLSRSAIRAPSCSASGVGSSTRII